MANGIAETGNANTGIRADSSLSVMAIAGAEQTVMRVSGEPRR